MPTSSNGTSTPTSDKSADHSLLLLEELTLAERKLAVSPNFKADLKSYGDDEQKEIWRRIREFYHQHVLQRSPQIVLQSAKKTIRCEGGKEEAWVFHLDGDNRIGVQYRNPTLMIRRVGPHSGRSKIYR
jgi:hypothetical protein